MTDDALPPDEADEVLAAEYVLGLLALPDREAASARLAREPRFAARVAEWENRLSPLNAAYAEASPPPGTIAAVEARLFPVRPRQPRLSRLWTWGATAAAVIALALWFALLPARPDYLATLAASGATFTAEVKDEALTITRTAGPAPDGSFSLELWLIVGDTAPRSLGLLTADRQTIPLPGAAAGQTLAISQEPPGGSPGDAPSGPILALAQLSPA